MRNGVGNSIKVLFRRHSDTVIVEATDTSVLLYNHEDLLPDYKYGVFTGVGFDFIPDGIIWEARSFDGEPLEFRLADKSFICIATENKGLLNEPVAEVFFGTSGFEFMYKPHLIERKV